MPSTDPVLPDDPIVGIVGVGVVGGVLRRWFAEEGPLRPRLALYDKHTGVGSVAEVDKADVVFVCVPTPRGGPHGLDDTAVVEALEILTGEPIVVIRSTVLPGSARRYQERFPRLRIASCPEFLRARSAWSDFADPTLQIVGCDDTRLGEAILGLLPAARSARVVSPDEAEMAKLFVNVFLAVKLTLANEIFDVCTALGIDYDVVRSIVAGDDRVHESHLDVTRGIAEFGRRGYSGACLPKDAAAFIDFATSLGVAVDVIAAADEVNARYGAAPDATV